MITPHPLIPVMATVVAIGCVEIRSSSRDQLSDQDSQIVIPLALAESKKAVMDVFARRGFFVTDEGTVRNGSILCTYIGNRGSVTVADGNQRGVAGTSSDARSIFYALYQPRGTQTYVTLFGKPTVNGRVTCSDYDQSLGIPCDEVVTGILWFGRGRTTGREEAETIRGIEWELKSAIAGVEQPSTPGILAHKDSPKNRMEENCNLEGTREWKNADALGRKLLLDECRRSH